MSDRTDLQDDIIHEASLHSDLSDKEIAEKLDCSASYVNQVRNEHSDEIKKRNSEAALIGVLLLLLLGFGAAHELGLI